MDLNARKERFSDTFVLAIASVAGCTITKPSLDHDSIDWTVTNRLSRRPKIDVQLKCTGNEPHVSEEFPFLLKKKNYDDLRLTGLTAPRILVVVVVPKDIHDWIDMRPNEMALRHCAYWLSLTGFPHNSNDTSVTIRVPTVQAFTVQSLCELMEKVNQGLAL